MDMLSKQIRDLEAKKSEFGIQLIKIAGKLSQNTNSNMNIDELLNNLNTKNFLDENDFNLILGNNSNFTKQQIRKSILAKPSDLNNNNNNYLNQEGKKIISDLKNDNKYLNRKFDDLKSKFEKEIINLKTEIEYKDQKIKDLESFISKKEKIINDLNNENYTCKSEIDFTKLKLNNITNKSDKLEEWDYEINKFKKEFDLLMRKKDFELSDVKETLESVYCNFEKVKKIEKVLKNQINDKDSEINKIKENLNEKMNEIDILQDDIINFKKENYNLKSSLTLGEIEFKNRYELENQLRNQEMKLLKENFENYLKYVDDLKDKIDKKRQIINNKKQMNVILCDLARVKKGEIQCLETLQYNNSDTIQISLIEIRTSEKELLVK